MAKCWRFGLVGAGRGWGYGRLIAADPRCQIVGCCDTSPEALGRFQRELELPDSRCFSDYDQFLAGVEMEAVLIGTPIPAHAEQTVKAVEAGVDVLCEVTAASSIEECGRIVEAVRRTGRIYMLAENCCFWPFIRQWQEMVRAGRLGEIYYSECEYLHPIPELIVDPATGRELWRAQRPPLHYCSHSLGPILEITQDRITRALGLGRGHRMMPDHPVPGSIDFQVALFETERNAIIKLARSSVLARHPAIHYYSLQGTKGFVETDRMGPSGGWLYVQGEMERAQPIRCSFVDESLPEAARTGGHGTAEFQVLQAFLRALETREQPALNEVRAMDLTAPGLVAHESATREGEWMEVPRFG
jgi:predicted dehydrogenase